jgi:hypothetical protein
MAHSVNLSQFIDVPANQRTWAKLINMGFGDGRCAEKRTYFVAKTGRDLQPQTGGKKFIYAYARCRMRSYAYLRFEPKSFPIKFFKNYYICVYIITHKQLTIHRVVTTQSSGDVLNNRRFPCTRTSPIIYLSKAM